MLMMMILSSARSSFALEIFREKLWVHFAPGGSSAYAVDLLICTHDKKFKSHTSQSKLSAILGCCYSRA